MGFKTKRIMLVGSILAALAVLGPLTFAQAGHTNTVLEARLRGAQEVGPNGPTERNVGDRNGTGEAYVFGIDGDPTTVCYVLLVNNIAPATAAHIHEAAKGANGPAVLNLAAPADGNAADCLTQGETGKFTIDPATGQPFTTVQEILNNPSDYYVNVHNAEFPAGAIRGQLKYQTEPAAIPAA